MDLKGRILAVDYGKKNIGLAHSDEFRLTVQPLPSLPNIGKKDFLRRAGALAETLEIREVVVGIPFRMDGGRGDAALAMEKIMRALEAALKLTVTEMDERLSTVEALEIWRKMTPRRQRKYRTVDSLAAALILERYIGQAPNPHEIKACDRDKSCMGRVSNPPVNEHFVKGVTQGLGFSELAIGDKAGDLIAIPTG